jgi:predicted ATPase/DNA-binding SARP family transcriptional activator
VPPAVRVDVLGPVTVTVDGASCSVTARRQRAVLACLALHAGEAVSADRLLEEVWGDDLPDTGRRAIPYQIARLRSSLEPERVGEGMVITTSSAGYVFEAAPESVDALRFEQLVDRARELSASDPVGCEALVEEALGLWRGRPFADLGDEPFVDRATRGLEQCRVVARRTLAEARLALGRPVEAIADLERLVGDHPLDETLVGLSMTALHRSGRTADALRAYGELRRRLSEELGIAPSHELQRLESELLADQDAQRPHTWRAIPKGVPAAVSSFVGRAEQLVGIEQRLSSARLVTLSGFGGLGKTRLAQETARSMENRFADGVWYVDLTPITDGTLVADTILAAGGLAVPPGRQPVDHLLSQLADRDVLIVLDNCEHLVEEVAEIVPRMLLTAPALRVLATSRVSLGVTGEAIWTVHPLDVPPGVELFTDRARLVRPGFVVDDANHHDVERLVACVDGIPLAIEMAAARLAVMGVDQIGEHLDERLGLLTRPGRDVDERQRSMSAVLDWSYQLLDEPDRALLRRMSMCAGGFDLTAATQIGDPDATIAPTIAPTSAPTTAPLEVLDRLGHLVEASLVVFDADHGTPRYRMLETVRQFAADRLDDDERARVGLAHATHYHAVAATIFDLFSTDFDAAVAGAERELGNLRAAMRWAYENAHAELGLSIARYARMYFHVKQMDRELLEWLSTGLELVDDDEPATLEAAAGASHAASNINDQERRDRAIARVERGLDSVDEPSLRAELLSALCSKVAHTDPRAADAYTRAAIELRASVPSRALALLANRIEVSWHVGGLDDGEAVLRRLTEILDELPTPDPARIKIETGVAALAGRWEDVVRIAEAAGDLEPMYESAVRLVWAEALGALGRHEDALAVLAPLDPDAVGYYFYFADLVHAAIDLRRHEPRAAARRLGALADEVGHQTERLAIGMQVAALLAVAAHDLGRHEVAALLFGYAAAEQQRLDITLRASDRPLAAQAIESCRVALGPQRFDELAAEGAGTGWSDLPSVDISEP